MSINKNKFFLRFIQNFYLLILLMILTIISSFLLGLLLGMAIINPITFIFLILFDLVSFLTLCYFVFQIKSINSSSELAATKQTGRGCFCFNSQDYSGILYRDKFYDEMNNVLEKDTLLACLAVLHIGIEFIERMMDHRKMDLMFDKITHSLQMSKNLPCLIGYKSPSEFWIFLYDSDQTTILECLDSCLGNLESIIKEASDTTNSSYIKCGYTWYPEHATNVSTLINNADFALYEAIIFKKKVRHEFSIDSYKKQETEYKRNALFDNILEKGQLTYHFQPIVKARDGSIYGYEALMRTKEPGAMTPLEILDIAQRQNRLYEIERATFFNVFDIISQNKWSVKDKKIFINSIPNYHLKSSDFDTLFNAYTNFLNQAVIEITECTNQTDESMDALHRYIHLMEAELALDDYGTGYSNDASLIKNNPHYIKIDRGLIAGINEDIKKQHLVSNIIEFAKQYNVLSLAEGVETYEELSTVICLGIDLIQGFYTARPSAEFLEYIPTIIKDKIINTYIMSAATKNEPKEFEASSTPTIRIIDLALDHYSSIVIRQPHTLIEGDPGKEVRLSINIPNHTCATITLQNVNLHGNDGPCIILGEESKVNIIIKEENILTYSGIRVPASSKLFLSGDGNLTIKVTQNNGIGIGGNNETTYGTIISSLSGNLNITSNGDFAFGIGGNRIAFHSEVKIIAGNINIFTTGNYAIGIGNLAGDTKVSLNDCHLDINCTGTTAIGIGSNSGQVNIDSCADIKMKLSASTCIGIGSIRNATGAILITNGQLQFNINAMYGTAIGSIDGDLLITYTYGETTIYGEGTYLGGIGNYNGTGLTHIIAGFIQAYFLAAKPISLGSIMGELIIEGGNIDCSLPPEIIPYNQFHDRLVYHHLENAKEYHKMIESPKGSYIYGSLMNPKIDGLHLYLPENQTV